MTTAFQLYLKISHLEPSGNPAGIEIKWKHKLLAHTDDLNLLGDKIDTIKSTKI
jgi:hypothetical protein